MRILFTFTGGTGHLLPLLPVARAAQRAGHDVAFAGSGNVIATAQSMSFTTFPTSPVKPRTVPDHSAKVVPVDLERENETMRVAFAGRGARRHAEVMPEIIYEFGPDVLVRDEVDFGTAVIAELLGLPCATVLVLAAGTFPSLPVIADPLNELRGELGLPLDPRLSMLERDLVLSPFPPGFRSPLAPLPATAFSYRSSPMVLRVPSRRPTVYFTLGTYDTNFELIERVLAGLREADVDAIVTIGDQLDPLDFGPQPPGIRLETYVPQDEVLPHCDLVIFHGGSGTLLGALAHGLPSILLPMGADQPYNADRCVELGVGLVLDPVGVTPAQVGEAIRRVLNSNSYRVAARRLRDEIAGLPDVDEAIRRVERLARGAARQK